MKTRILTAAVCIAVFIPVLIFSDTIVFPIAISVLSVVAVGEAVKCMKLKLFSPIAVLSYIPAAALPFLCRYAEHEAVIKYTLIYTAVFMFIAMSHSMLSKGKIPFSLGSETAIFLIYIVLGMSAIMFIRDSENGNYLYLLIFIGAWMTDTGAYFIGVLFGKHKLIPEVSPKKTIEGAVGGIFGAVIGFAVYGIILDYFFDVSVNYLVLALTAIPIAVASQLGDLIASYIKREKGIKDYGKLFPGHGGVLDRFDSVIAVAVFILIYIISGIPAMFS